MTDLDKDDNYENQTNCHIKRLRLRYGNHIDEFN